MSDFPQPIEYDALPIAVMDYCTLRVIGRVAQETLVAARVNRIVGLEGGDVILAFDCYTQNGLNKSGDTVREKDGFDKWLFSADTRLFRVHPWPDPLPGKSISSHLIEVATHHLSGARVIDIWVERFERIITIKFSRREYTGEEIEYRLIAELMGKHSNLILVDSSDVILATYKPVHSYQSRVREIRAGKEYRSPPRQDRIEPRGFTPTQWSDFLNSAELGDPLDDHISRTFLGMSLAWARNICDRGEVFAEKIVAELTSEEGERLRFAIEETIPLVLDGVPLTGESPRDFVRRISADFYERAEDFALDKNRAKITKIINRRRKKLRSLGKGLNKDLDQAGRADDYKKKADLLLANLYKVQPGTTEIIIDDWETDGKIQLSLDPHSTPQFQVERWYKRYRKLKRTQKIAHERQLTVRAEEDELTRLEEKLAAAASVDEINEIREQCVLHGLISLSDFEHQTGIKTRGKGRRDVQAKISAHRYRSNDGFLIAAGTNNMSNDALRRASSPDDIWLHVRDIPGSHVFIITRGQNVPQTTLSEAAMVAVWHSKAREGSNVPVDYTRVKYTTSIPGARPGKVIFRRERTIRTTPDEKRIEMMRLMAGDERSPKQGK